MPLWMLSSVLFVVTIAAFFWALASSGAPTVAPAPQRRSRAPGGADDDELADAYEVEAPDGAMDASAPPVAQGRSGSALAWATFAISAFGTTSTFVLSMMTYLKDTP